MRKIRNLFLYFSFNPPNSSISITSYPVPHQNTATNKKSAIKQVEWIAGGIMILRIKEMINV